MNTMNFTGMQDAARQIENLAFLLRAAAENGTLSNTGDDTITEDTAAMIQERARELGMMIEQAQTVARDKATA